jgi:hypothetical protein
VPDFGVPDDGFLPGLASLLLVDDDSAGFDSAGFDSLLEPLLSELFDSLLLVESEELDPDEPLRCAFLP